MRKADRFRHLRREALFWGVAVLVGFLIFVCVCVTPSSGLAEGRRGRRRPGSRSGDRWRSGGTAYLSRMTNIMGIP
jgi:hypothetical protein